MRNLALWLVFGILTSAGAALAAPRVERSADLLPGKARANARAPAAAARVSPDVGDVDSFERKVRFIGVAQTDLVLLSLDCAAEPPDPETRCVQLAPAPEQTEFDERDLAMIRLPAGATHSLLCHSITPIATFQLGNFAFFPELSLYRLTAGVTIESEVLNDPRFVDPFTGEPAAGRLETPIGLALDQQTLQPFETQTRREASTRNCIAGLVNRGNFTAGGVPADLQDRFFAEPMTLRFHVEGAARNVFFGQILYGVRLYGD